MSASKKYHVYVIELSKRVWSERAKFRAENPQYNGVAECLYVGMTSLSPQQRFKKHVSGARSKKGHKISSNYVEKYGLYLRPSLYTHLEPMSRTEALQMERTLALKLRKQRFAVWFN